MSDQGDNFLIPSALAARLMPAGDGREQLTARHLERARQCCSELLSLADECAPSTRVLVAYLVLLHDGLAVLATRGWRVAPSDSQADALVLEVIATFQGIKPQLSSGVRFAAVAREAELKGSFVSDQEARSIQASALDVHKLVEWRLEGRRTSAG